MWPGPDILEAASQSGYPRHIGVLLGAGVLTGLGQLALQHLSSANGIDITEAITCFAGRLPAARTVGSAVLSVIVPGGLFTPSLALGAGFGTYRPGSFLYVALTDGGRHGYSRLTYARFTVDL